MSFQYVQCNNYKRLFLKWEERKLVDIEKAPLLKIHFMSCEQHEKSTCLYQNCIIWSHLEGCLYGSLKTFSIKSLPLSCRKESNDSGSIAACEWLSKPEKILHQDTKASYWQSYNSTWKMPMCLPWRHQSAWSVWAAQV